MTLLKRFMENLVKNSQNGESEMNIHKVNEKVLDTDWLRKNILDRFVKGYTKEISCDDGWMGIVADCHSELLGVDPSYKIFQIKEKFGTLRFYFETSDMALMDKMNAVTLKYEKLSAKTCEISGSSGVLMKKGGSMKTLNEKLGETLGYKKVEGNQ
jgi:hypothetical protein